VKKLRPEFMKIRAVLFAEQSQQKSLLLLQIESSTFGKMLSRLEEQSLDTSNFLVNGN